MKPIGIGDRSCKNNAHSLDLRCAINPSGPCEGCPDFARASLGDQLKRQFWGLDVRNTPAVKDAALQSLLGAFVGINVGVALLGFVVVPVLNQVIIHAHPCWPVIGVT